MTVATFPARRRGPLAADDEKPPALRQLTHSVSEAVRGQAPSTLEGES